MDFDMPCLDGIQAARLIKRAGEQIGYAPVIVMVTSEDTSECRSLAKDAGASGFVSKAENLRGKLKATLNHLFSENREPLLADRIEASDETLCA
jgi:CheY-like chemotaxis protein